MLNASYGSDYVIWFNTNMEGSMLFCLVFK